MKFRDSRCAALALCALSVPLTQHTFAQSSTHSEVQLPVQKLAKAIGNDTTREFELSPRPTPTENPAPRTADGAPLELLGLADSTLDGLLFDSSADGALWARGRSYKASFAGDAATVIPFFGSEAPQNYPIEFRVGSVTLAGEALPCETPARAVRKDRIVSLDRATFVEEYVLEENQLEQRFVFDTLPRRGELVLKIDVATELSIAEFGEALRFSNDLGHVDYGAAIAIDASGARIPIERSFVDGAIRLTVPDEFVSHAALPLTIDPLVTLFTVAQGSLQKESPDASFDSSSGRWCVVYEDVFSAADHDVTAKLLSPTTGAVEAILTVDATSDYWTTPKAAFVPNVASILIVAAVDPAPVASNKGTIRGRRLNVGAATIGPVLQISPSDATDRYNPDVGGDPFNGFNARFCIVWQHDVSASIVKVEMQMMTQAGLLEGGVVTLEGTTGRNTKPAISKSTGKNGMVGPTAERWTVAWQYEFNATDHDIYARQVAWNGALLGPAFIVDDSTLDDTEPAVASVLDTIDGQRFALIVHQRSNFVQEDIIGTLLSGGTVVESRNLSLDEPLNASNREFHPTVDSDGRHFLVGHVELYPGGDTNLLVSDYFVSGGALVPAAVQFNFAGTFDAETGFELCSQYSSSLLQQRFIGVYESTSASASVIKGGYWNVERDGTVRVMCAGDGSGTACPCGNTGAFDRGCANSQTLGGQLSGSNVGTRVSSDSFVLHASSMPTFTTCLYFQGSALNASGAGFVFGDGKLCASGTVIRLGIKTGSISQFPDNNPDISVLGLIPAGGATRYYQVWYRDAAVFCTNFSFNLTNAVQVVWAP